IDNELNMLDKECEPVENPPEMHGRRRTYGQGGSRRQTAAEIAEREPGMDNIGSVSVRFGPMCRTDNFGDGVGPDRLKNELGPNRTETDPKTMKTDRSVRSMDDNGTGPDRCTY